MKKAIKVIALFMTAAMTIACFAGCSKNEQTQATTDGKSFTLWTAMDGNSTVSLMSYNEMLFFQELEKLTGVHIDFIHPIAGSTGNEAFVTMISGSERPDIMEYYWTSYTGGPQQAIDDGVIVALNDYLKDHAPNYYDYMEGEKGKANGYQYKVETTTEQGQYYGFNALNIGDLRCFAGLYVRADKLEQWGLDIPETIDDWAAVFAKAKADGFNKPFTTNKDVMSYAEPYHGFNTAFDVGKNIYIDNGKATFAPFQKGYKEFVALMAEWTKLGYVDTGFVTNDSAKIEGNIANGYSIAAYGWVSTLDKLTTAAKEKFPSFSLAACPFPSAKKGEPSRFGGVSGEATPTAYGISTTCGNIEKAIEWCDNFYTEEGSVLRNFGVEGDTYTIEEKDGEKHYVYTEKITNYKDEGFTSIAQALYKYMLPANHPGLNQHPDYLAGYYPLPAQIDAVEVWNKGVPQARKTKLPEMLAYTEDEAREKTDILEVARPELDVAISNIILGKASIDTYDAAIEKAKENGYDRVLEIEQAAYDRYMSKLDK